MPSQKFYDTIACNWGDGVPAAGSKYLGSRATWLRCTRCDGTEMRLKLFDELPNAGSYGFAFECEHVRTGHERPNDGATLGRILYCAKIYKREPREVTNELKLKKSREARDAHYTYNRAHLRIAPLCTRSRQRAEQIYAPVQRAAQHRAHARLLPLLRWNELKALRQIIEAVQVRLSATLTITCAQAH